MEASTSTPKKAAASSTSTKDAEAEARLSHQAQFSTYEEAPPPDEPQNPPSGHSVVQTPGEAHEGPVENPLAKGN